MVPSLFWKRVLWFCQSWELGSSNFNLGYTLDSSGEAFKNHNCRLYPDQIKKNLWGEIQTWVFFFVLIPCGYSVYSVLRTSGLRLRVKTVGNDESVN